MFGSARSAMLKITATCKFRRRTGAKSVDGKIFFFSRYPSYNKIELAKQFCVSMCGSYSVWKIP